MHDLESEQPRITYAGGELRCDVIAGCDGFHGICRPAIPDGVLTEHEFVYPFGWLGILAEARADHRRADLRLARARLRALLDALARRSRRLYLQVAEDEQIEAWPDARIWEELQLRLGTEGWRVGEGPIVDKGITPMRSFVCEPMQYGRLFLAGDAAHIVPPTGAKGLNLAVNDVRLLAEAMREFYSSGSSAGLDGYSEAAARRVWRAQDFSHSMTQLLHDLGGGAFQQQLQLARLEYIERSEAAARSLAENYVGLPAAADF